MSKYAFDFEMTQNSNYLDFLEFAHQQYRNQFCCDILTLAQPKFLLFLLFGFDIGKYHKKCSKNFIFLTNFLRY